MTKPPQFFEIPANTNEAECRSCGAAVYWIITAAGKRMPVSIDIDGAFAPMGSEGGRGISHFVDCPNRDSHRKPR